ncbi:MAG: DUF4395 domain-containing protein [Aggregatilineales bacterium]
MSEYQQIDHSALRTNQALIIGFLALAFVLDAPLLVAFVAVVMSIGALIPQARLFVRIYKHILKPAGLIKPDVIVDNPEPHRFSMALGAVFTSLSALALLAGLTTIGWILSFIVIALASLNLVAGFCAGCFMYYQFNRLGVPGFNRAPVGQGVT